MPGILRPGLQCPTCGRSVLMVIHVWAASHDQATFEYHHHDDVEREARGEPPQPCIESLSFEEGQRRYEAESAPMRIDYGEH